MRSSGLVIAMLPAAKALAHLVALIRAGAKFANSILAELPDETASGDTHAA
jgi:hypothetical protein